MAVSLRVGNGVQDTLHCVLFHPETRRGLSNGFSGRCRRRSGRCGCLLEMYHLSFSIEDRNVGLTLGVELDQLLPRIEGRRKAPTVKWPLAQHFDVTGAVPSSWNGRRQGVLYMAGGGADGR